MTSTTWLIVVIAVIGFAFDTYELLVMPLINRPALAELLHVDRYTDAGTQAILQLEFATSPGPAPSAAASSACSAAG